MSDQSDLTKIILKLISFIENIDDLGNFIQFQGFLSLNCKELPYSCQNYSKLKNMNFESTENDYSTRIEFNDNIGQVSTVKIEYYTFMQ